MAINFDDLLKKGKQNAAGPKTVDTRWREYIGGIMHLVHILNDMYSTGKKHNLKLDSQSCADCGEPTFILTVRELEAPHKPLHFHKAGWKYDTSSSKYYCDKCRKA